MAFEEITVIGPAHWASYLINGDATGFDYYNTPDDKAGDRDYAAAQAFEKWCVEGGGHIVGCSEESSFYWRHDASQFDVKGCDCLEYTILIDRSKFPE